MTDLTEAVKHLSPVVTRVTDLVIDRAKGAKFWTTEGDEYIDFVSGIAVNALGHAHPEVVEAIREQAGKLIHLGLNYGYYESVIKLAEKIAKLAPGDLDTVLFSNSGSESIDGAIKLARAATGRPVIIAFDGSFHGRTIGATSVTASSAKYRKYYEPLMGGVYHAPYPYALQLGYEDEDECVDYCLTYIKNLLELKVDPSQVAAFLIEPFLGEGGYVPAPASFLKELRRISDEHGILLIFDEVQSGFGRTGRMFCSEHSGVVPDILVLAKAIASGMPLGAVVANRAIHEKWPVGSHGSTYGGNPISCAAANASLEVIERENLVERAETMGAMIHGRLQQSVAKYSEVAQIRRLGLMMGIEFRQGKRPLTELVQRIKQIALGKRLLVQSCGVYGQTIRLMLPLNIDEFELNQGLDLLESSIAQAIEGGGF